MLLIFTGLSMSFSLSTNFLKGNGELSQDEVKRSVADYGKVVIKIWRSSLKRSGPLLTKAYVPNKMVSSKAVIVDSHVSHTIGYVVA